MYLAQSELAADKKHSIVHAIEHPQRHLRVRPKSWKIPELLFENQGRRMHDFLGELHLSAEDDWLK